MLQASKYAIESWHGDKDPHITFHLNAKANGRCFHVLAPIPQGGPTGSLDAVH
jgi:hypothetical protein